MTLITEIKAIDVHAHLGKRVRGDSPLLDQWCSADATKMIEWAANARTQWTIVSALAALMPRFNPNVLAGNIEADEATKKTDGLLYWVVVNPLEKQSYQQAEEMLGNPKCVGIKIHPEEHGYPIKEHGQALFEFAAKHQAVVLTHSGEENSMPEDFVPFANTFPEVRLILAHIGCTCDGDPTHQVRAVQTSKRGNIYADTSSAQSIMPGLVEFAVDEIGPERIVYGTDSPLYFAPMQRARIDHADISDKAKRLILRDNAAKLLGLGDD